MSFFYAHPAMSDGHVNKCKECNKKDVSENRLKNIEYYRSYDSMRAKLPERAKEHHRISALWRQADRRRMSAHNAVSRAIKKGILVRQPCEKCGSKKSLGHHESYDNKLDVKWLCQPCHKARHKEMVLQGIDP